jgi:hypothetical protein
MKPSTRKRKARHRPHAVAGEYIVKMQAPESAHRLFQSCHENPADGWKIRRLSVKTGDTVLVSRTADKKEEHWHPATKKKLAKARCAQEGNVEYIHRNHLWHLDRKPNDPRYDDPGMWGLKKVGAPAAWERTTGDKSVIVAVVDSGIDYKHPDLTANIWINAREASGSRGVDDDGNGVTDDLHGANFGGETSGDPMDLEGHGTHLAGTIAAAGNNGTGIVGMNWRVSLMAVRFVEEERKRKGPTSAVTDAIKYAVRMGAVIINASWSSRANDPTLNHAIDEAREHGVLFVASAGQRRIGGGVNTDELPFFPACYALENILVVQSSKVNDELLPNSNFGRKTVDIAAPGLGVLSTFPKDAYKEMDGTSMATAYVSGAAALVKSLAPSWGYAELKQQLLRTAKLRPELKGKSVTGGLLNVDAATQAPLRITCPEKGERWQGSGTAVVHWRQKPCPSGCRCVELSIDLEFSIDDGKTWQPLASNVAMKSGKATVAVPNAEAKAARVRARCTGTNLFAYSEEFAIDSPSNVGR